MIGELLLPVCVGAVLVVTLFLVPARSVRATGLAAAMAIVMFGANDTAGNTVYRSSLIAASLVLALALLRVRSGRKGPKGLQLTIGAWWVFAFVGSLILGTYSTQRFVFYALAAMFAAHVALRLDRRSVTLFLRLTMALLGAQVLLAIAELTVMSVPLWGYRGGVRENPFVPFALVRTQGTFGHPIVFGYFMALMLVLAWTNAARLPRWLVLLAVATAGTGLFLSGTRSAVLASVAAIALHVLTRKGLARWLRNLLVVVTAAGLALGLGLGSTLSTLTSELLDSGSWVQRIGSLRSVPALLGRSPAEVWMGSGFGSDARLFEQGYFSSLYHLTVIDDMFVNALATTGIVGLLLLLAAAVLAFVRGDRAGRALILCTMAMMFSFDTMVWLSTGIVATVVLAMPRLHEEEPAPVIVADVPALTASA